MARKFVVIKKRTPLRKRAAIRRTPTKRITTRKAKPKK